MGFVANFVRFPAVQKVWKSVKIWQSYRQLNGGNFFETQCIVIGVTNVATARLQFLHAAREVYRRRETL